MSTLPFRDIVRSSLHVKEADKRAKLTLIECARLDFSLRLHKPFIPVGSDIGH